MRKIVPDWLANIKRLIFETTNLCNMHHLRCPATKETEPKHLPLFQVIETMNLFGGWGWHGTVGFHNYCEPLMEPRLFVFVREARDRGWPVQIWTNGSLLSQQIVDELILAGVAEFSVSLYTVSETERLTALDWGLAKVHLHPSQRLDDRLDWSTKPEQDDPRRCFWPQGNALIRHDGTVALCCFDWQNWNASAKLGDDSLWRLLEERAVVAEALAEGERDLPFCRRCPIGP